MHPNMVGLSPERGFLQHNLERATQSCRAASLNAATSYSCQWLLQATRLLTLRPASPCPGPWPWGSKEAGCPNAKKDSGEWDKLGHGTLLPAFLVPWGGRRGWAWETPPLPHPPFGDFQTTSYPQHSGKWKHPSGALFGSPWPQQVAQSWKNIQP